MPVYRVVYFRENKGSSDTGYTSSENLITSLEDKGLFTTMDYGQWEYREDETTTEEAASKLDGGLTKLTGGAWVTNKLLAKIQEYGIVLAVAA